MKNQLISIIIPCYNDHQYVEQAVNSAINQTYKNKEIIVVDDGSDKKTKEVLRNLEDKISLLITQDNQGQSKARNIGISRAKGQYIVTLDSDDFFEREFCAEALNAFKTIDDTILVSCYSKLIFENSNEDIYQPSGGNINNVLIKNVAMGSVMFSKESWKHVSGYDEDMRDGFEDWEFYIRLLSNGGQVTIIKQPLFNYRKRLNSTTAIANSKKYELLMYIYRKHQNLYKNRFDAILMHLLKRIEFEEKEKLKNRNSLEFRLGKSLLKPLRYLIRLF